MKEYKTKIHNEVDKLERELTRNGYMPFDLAYSGYGGPRTIEMMNSKIPYPRAWTQEMKFNDVKESELVIIGAQIDHKFGDQIKEWAWYGFHIDNEGTSKRIAYEHEWVHVRKRVESKLSISDLEKKVTEA
jgi:hypothetical protein